MTYYLYNSGSIPLNWHITPTAPWISVSTTSGSISPMLSGSVNVNINSIANTLLAGNYTASLQFVNTTNLGTTTRLISLIVNPPTGSAILSVYPTSTVVFVGNVGGPFV